MAADNWTVMSSCHDDGQLRLNRLVFLGFPETVAEACHHKVARRAQLPSPAASLPLDRDCRARTVGVVPNGIALHDGFRRRIEMKFPTLETQSSLSPF